MQNVLKFAAATLMVVTSSGTVSAAGGTVVSVTDHSLPKATIRTYHALCQPQRLVIIRVDPAAPTVCGDSQDTGQSRVCLPKSAANPEETVKQVAVRLCN